MSVPIRPAATVMLVEDRPDLQVLMLRRHARHVFASDMWVYPGGAVDPADADIARDVGAHDSAGSLDDGQASSRLSVPTGGLAYWVAAIRECFEEAGVLFARDAQGRAVDVTAPAVQAEFAATRLALNAHELSFAEVLRRFELTTDASALHYAAHWITPLGPPRRFDTRFFVAQFPSGQVATHDDGEAVHDDWVRPAEAIQRWRAGSMSMMSPTVRMLMSLGRHKRATDAVAMLAEVPPLRQVRVRSGYSDEPNNVLLPEDPGYEQGDPDTEFGWVAL